MPPDSSSASVLIVDDDRASLLGMHELLLTLGARLVTARSGEEALRKVLDEDFAAILLDVHMPGIDGFTTAKLIRDRKRARYIHDELGQALTGLKLDLNGLARAVDQEDIETVQERSRALCTAIDRIINSVRRIASGLRPEVLDEIGLSAAIEWQAREFQRRTGIRCNVEIGHGFTDPDTEQATALFRIYQELLTNVARHANATRVNVTL